MFKVEKMKQKDLSFAVKLANTMNWNMTKADFTFNMKMEPEGCLMLKDNGVAVGLATCISYEKVGWFGNLIVEEWCREHGAGTMLVKHATEYLQSKGVTTIGLYGYKHLVNFYGSVGFKQDVDFSVLKTEQIKSPNDLDDSLKTAEPTQRDIAQMIELDTECFGGSRAKLLDTILQEKSNLIYFHKEKNQVTGFSAAKVYEGIAEIGPLVCSKTQKKTAKKLFSAILNKLEGSEAYMYIQADETELIEEASRFGLKEEFKLARMFLGPPVQKDCTYLAESLERG